MRLICEVLSVTSDGEQLIVELQGHRTGAASWRRYGKHKIMLDDTALSRKAYHLGRRVIINISASK